MQEQNIYPGQVWKHSYSSERIKIISHVTSGMWEIKNIKTNKIRQIYDSELLESWKKLYIKNKLKPIT